MCTKIDIDSLDWKSWPKDQLWVYCDIEGAVRVSMNRVSENLLVRELEENGCPTGILYTPKTKGDALEIIQRLLASHNPADADDSLS